MYRVFVLGAGFSKAINADMPLLADLSRGVKDTLATKSIDVGPDLDALDDVEQWLTLLAEPAPWLRASDQMHNNALFSDVSQAIHDVLIAMQIQTSVEAPPDWLIPLVVHWRETNATVITFNYDALVELAYASTAPPGSVSWASDLYAIPVTPAGVRLGATGRLKPPAFKLLKLHGSLDWWYSGPDAEQSDPIYWMGWTGRFGAGMQPLWAEFGADLLVDDKVPMLIPPAATKAPFYRNRLLAAQWKLAAKALNQAEELVLMGYSAPLTDLPIRSLVSTQFKGQAIIPVNRDRGAIERVHALGNRTSPPEVIDSFIDENAIAKWTETFAS